MQYKFEGILNYNGFTKNVILECTPKIIALNNNIIWKIEDIYEVIYTENKTILKNKNNQVLEITQGFLEFNVYSKKHYKYHKHFNKKNYWFYKNKISISFSFVIIILILSLLFILIIAYNNSYKLITINKEKELGKILYENELKNYTTQDSATYYIQEFFDYLNWESKFKTKIIVVKNNETNAFAIPGGYIFIFDSIIKISKNYEQLAGLLGHEFSHIELRHSLKSTINNIGIGLFLSYFLRINNALSEIILNLNSLKYSRNLETEADENATNLLIQKNINPTSLFYLFNEISKNIKNEYIPEFLKTHPDFENRNKNINKFILNKNYTIKNNLILQNIYNKLQKSLK